MVVSRAGANSIAEISLWGKPAILIPIPESVSHDQRTNAYSYAHTGAAIVLEEENLTPHLFVSEIKRIMSDSELEKRMGLLLSALLTQMPHASSQTRCSPLRLHTNHEHRYPLRPFTNRSPSCRQLSHCRICLSFAKHSNGKFIIRIEDTDAIRSKSEYIASIFEMLAWLDLTADETYRQSEHRPRHRELLEKLVADNTAYVSKETPQAPGTGKRSFDSEIRVALFLSPT